MAKLKSPLLSLGAHGTLGKAVTFQRRYGTTFAREKPIPTDLKTLDQMYQRWDYQDYIAQWQALTPAEKLVYRKAGSKLRLPAFAYFMRVKLETLPDLVGRWRLDNITNALTPDSSKNNNPGTITGAFITPGRIGNCLSFDGIDDEVNLGRDPSLNVTDELSVQFFIYIKTWGGSIIGEPALSWPWAIRLEPAVNYKFRQIIRHPDGSATAFYSLLLSPIADYMNRWIPVTCTYSILSGTNIWYLNGAINLATATAIKPVRQLIARDLRISKQFHGLIDHAAIYNRELTLADHIRFAERRYPL